MTYSPAQAGVMTGEDYFTSQGLIGGSTGMSVILNYNPVMVTPDAYSSSLTRSVTNSVLKITTGGVGDQCSWALGDTYDKVLGICYIHGGTNGDFAGIGFSENAYSGSQSGSFIEDAYNYGCSNTACIGYVHNGSSWAAAASDTTIFNDVVSAPNSPAFGVATYLEDNVQKVYYKFGSESQWVQIFSETDGTNTNGYQSLTAGTPYHSGKIQRFISPIMVWGA